MVKLKIPVHKGQIKRGKIGRAAARVFNKKGYMETNIDDIAAAANMSKGGVYHYFSSKDEILYFILDTYMDTVLKDLRSQLQDLQGGAAKIKFIIERHIDLYANHVAQAKTLLHDAHCLSPKHFKAISVKEREYYQIVTDVLSEYFEGTAKMKRKELKAMAFLLFGMCNWSYHWYDPKGPIKPGELSRMIWTVFLKGIAERRKA